MKQIDNNNGLIRASVLTRLRKYIRYYEDNSMTKNDKNLLAEIFMRKSKEYKEDL